MRIALLLVAATAALLLAACGDSANTDADVELTPPGQAPTDMIGTATNDAGPRLSLAQWSLHKRYLPEGVMGGTGAGDPYDFPADAKALGFEGVEYVSQLYAADLKPGAEHAASVMAVQQRLREAAEAAGIEEVLIMIDREGDLASPDAETRAAAVVNHRHWIDAASASGIPTVRVNLSGEGSKDAMHRAAVESLTQLGRYAAGTSPAVNVVVENHGGYSSDPAWLRDVMAAVGLANVGILPDFGNFCRDGWPGDCRSWVPRDSSYVAVGMWMPYAHAVSAKSYAFDADGDETTIDYARMLDTVRAHGYTGFIGVEYEGDAPEEEGIAATKALIERNLRG